MSVLKITVSRNTNTYYLYVRTIQTVHVFFGFCFHFIWARIIKYCCVRLKTRVAAVVGCAPHAGRINIDNIIRIHFIIIVQFVYHLFPPRPAVTDPGYARKKNKRYEKCQIWCTLNDSFWKYAIYMLLKMENVRHTNKN